MKDPNSLTIRTPEEVNREIDGRNPKVESNCEFGKWMDKICARENLSITRFAIITGSQHRTISKSRSASSPAGREALRNILSSSVLSDKDRVEGIAAWSTDVLREIRESKA